jgi:hypothetical protein
MTDHFITRRKFLERTGVATATLVGSSFFSAKRLLAAPPYVRRDVGEIGVSLARWYSVGGAATTGTGIAVSASSATRPCCPLGPFGRTRKDNLP